MGVSTTHEVGTGTCKALTRDGRPCGGYAVSGSDYCFSHDPGSAERRIEVRSRGGKARHARSITPPGGRDPVELTGLADAIPLLERMVNDTLFLENSVARSRAVAYLVEKLTKIFEVTEVEQRLVELEEKLSKE